MVAKNGFCLKTPTSWDFSVLFGFGGFGFLGVTPVFPKKSQLDGFCEF